MIEIMKASAGSGKTYNLARTYIRLLLSSDDRTKYRHILAVTFTNKATAEMKSRILKELHILSTRPEKSSYFKDFVPSLLPSSDALARKSREALLGILHDYSAFAVSTIDRFFQLALKAFSREIGYFSAYQVELDTESIITEAVDRMLDSMTREDKELLGWIVEGVGEDLENGKRSHFEKKLVQTGMRLKSTEHSSVEKASGSDSECYSKENVRAASKELRGFIKSFEERIVELSKKAIEAISSSGLDESSFSRNWVSPVYAWADGSSKNGFSESFLSNCTDPSKWFRKADAPKYLPLAEGALSEALGSLAGEYSNGQKAYRTALLLLPSLHALGLAKEFYDSFDALVAEKNIMSLDDSNTILRRIIDGSGTPFIYEKLGVRYENFLLDEFQDTSSVQWENFLPLLRESDDNGRNNLVVGDVKQSIYRFRGSDWGLLDSELPAAFPLSKGVTLSDNWRSLPEIVEFNNAFFGYMATSLGGKIGDIYSTVAQTPHGGDAQRGHVHITFTTEDGPSQEEMVVSMVESARSRGAEFRDMAVLVRGHQEGALVASVLIGKGIPVISDDSLLVKSSLIVRRLTALLSAIDNPDDSVSTYLSKAVGLPSGLNSTTLVDLCEDILRHLRSFDPTSFEGEVLHIQSFMDTLQDWNSSEGNDLHGFLEFWEEQNPKITSPEDADAVTIMTIHKSKGLEFPYVIVPFAEKIGKRKTNDNWHWCFFDSTGTPFSKAVSMPYPVNITSQKLAGTYLEPEMEKDKLYTAVDDMNIAYVAFTRACKSLEVISSSEKGGDLSYFLRLFTDKYGCSFGEEYVFEHSSDCSGESPFAVDYPSVPLGDRLSLSSDASDFFSSEGLVGAGASARLWGIACHEILSKIVVPSDIDSAVEDAVSKGDISSTEASGMRDFLSQRIASHSEWFSGGLVRNEQSVIDNRDLGFYRPDRVIETASGEIVIVDFKFGDPRPSYASQIGRYMDIYSRMGYKSVRGYLWYVKTDIVEEIRGLF